MQPGSLQSMTNQSGITPAFGKFPAIQMSGGGQVHITVFFFFFLTGRSGLPWIAGQPARPGRASTIVRTEYHSTTAEWGEELQRAPLRGSRDSSKPLPNLKTRILGRRKSE